MVQHVKVSEGVLLSMRAVFMNEGVPMPSNALSRGVPDSRVSGVPSACGHIPRARSNALLVPVQNSTGP